MTQEIKDLDRSLTISRVNPNERDAFVSLTVRDDNSRTIFLRLEIDMQSFADTLTGLACVHCTGDVRGLDRIGKTEEIKQFKVDLPKSAKFRDKVAAKKAVLEACPEGWTPDLHFSSQDSFFIKGNSIYSTEDDETVCVRTVIRRWVDNPVEEEG